MLVCADFDFRKKTADVFSDYAKSLNISSCQGDTASMASIVGSFATTLLTSHSTPSDKVNLHTNLVPVPFF